jgi:hypothetical protein
VSIIHGGVAIRDFDMAPAFEQREHHEQIGRAVFNTSGISSHALIRCPGFIGTSTRGDELL